MKEINLGHILIENRHKRGITQDELASYIGVSKAAVSKWETGTTYPDITLLPQLATYFKEYRYYGGHTRIVEKNIGWKIRMIEMRLKRDSKNNENLIRR